MVKVTSPAFCVVVKVVEGYGRVIHRRSVVILKYKKDNWFISVGGEGCLPYILCGSQSCRGVWLHDTQTLCGDSEIKERMFYF